MNMFGLPPPGSDERRKRTVWNKGTPIPGYDPNVWRRDAHGNAMRFSDHGNRDSKYGWEIDHIRAVALGGSDDLSNLRPLRCSVNASLGGILGNALTGRR